MIQKILSYLKQVMLVFAFDVGFLIFVAVMAGDQLHAQVASSMFQLGSRGLAVETLLQFLFTSFVVNGVTNIFDSERLTKKVRLIWRLPLLLFTILAFISGCILAFDWFPADFWEGWLSFLGMFLLCFSVSCLLMLAKKHSEDLKYERQLRQYKERHGEKE